MSRPPDGMAGSDLGSPRLQLRYQLTSVVGKRPEFGLTKDSSASKLKSRGLPGMGLRDDEQLVSDNLPNPRFPWSAAPWTLTCEQTPEGDEAVGPDMYLLWSFIPG